MSETNIYLSEKDFSKWLPLDAVLAKATERMGDNAHEKVVTRLCNGSLVARAEDSFVAERSGTKLVLPDRSMVSKAVWKKVKHIGYKPPDSLWETSTVIETIGRRSNGAGVRYEHFGVRVDPAGVAKMLPEAPKVSQKSARSTRPARRRVSKSPAIDPVDESPVAASEPGSHQPSQTEPSPLSSAALKLWYAAYRAGYDENEQSLDHAWTRAQLSFPDKLVTRQVVQDLMSEAAQAKG